MKLIGDLIIKCNSCGVRYTIDTNMLDEDSFSVGEFGMGDRVQHEFVGEIECDNCGEKLFFKLCGYEYPVGALEYQDVETNGCDVIEEPFMEMEYLPEPVLSIYEQILYDPQSIYNLEPWEFENLVAEVLEKNGYCARVTQKTRDGGVDIKASFFMGGVLYNTYFECKKYSACRPVGASIVRELYGVVERDRIEKGVIVTTSHFTRDAKREAESYNGRIQLIDYDGLLRMIRRII